MELETIYLEIAPQDIAFVKFVFESYEEVGLIRTVDRKRAIIVLLAMPDFAETARDILASIAGVIELREVARPADMSDDWFMAEIASAADVKTAQNPES